MDRETETKKHPGIGSETTEKMSKRRIQITDLQKQEI